MTNGPSPHLSWSELACWDRRVFPWILLASYPASWRPRRATRLADTFELVRAYAADDQPLIVLSAYRTPDYNREIGGALASLHCQGLALDLQPPSHLTTIQFWRRLLALQPSTAIRGLGRYRHFVHLDVRASPDLVLWSHQATED